MKDYLKYIENKLRNSTLSIEDIKILDNTNKHKTHKFFDKNKYHLHLEVKSKKFKNINKIEAQRKIMNVLKEELKNKIHALEIKIT